MADTVAVSDSQIEDDLIDEADLDGWGVVDDAAGESDALVARMAGGTARAGQVAAVEDRMPGAPSEGQADEGFPRVALDTARQVYFIAAAAPAAFLDRVRDHYRELIAGDKPREWEDIITDQLFEARILETLTESSALAVYLMAAAGRLTPRLAAIRALNEDIARALQARSAALSPANRIQE